MDAKLITLSQSVAAGVEIRFTYLGQGPLTVHPYVYGFDVFDVPFLFGYVPELGCCYRFYCDGILNLEKTVRVFKMPESYQAAYFTMNAKERLVDFSDRIVVNDGRFPRSLFYED